MYLNLFKKTRASDEMYFPCAMGVLGLIDEGSCKGDDSGRQSALSSSPHASNAIDETEKTMTEKEARNNKEKGKSRPVTASDNLRKLDRRWKKPESVSCGRITLH